VIPPKISRKYLFLYVLLLLLVLIDRANALYYFSFEYTDCDQAVMWLGAKEILNGHFREPCFYGQSYNPMLESLFATPLVGLGIDYYQALPVVTSILALSPFIILSLFFLKKQPLHACIIISFPLLMPAGYGMISSMSRGFVTGIFFASFACLSVYTVNNKIKWMLYSFTAGVAVIANPNSLIVLFPLYVYLILNNYKNFRFCFSSLAGVIPAALLFFFIKQFYILHPGYNLHQMQAMIFYPHVFRSAFIYPNEFFWNVVPFSESIAWQVFLITLFVLISILFKQKERAASISLASVFLLVLFSWGFYKLHEGGVTVFFPTSRMFIGLPLLMVLFVPKIENIGKIPFSVLICTAVLFFSVKLFNIHDVIKNDTLPETDHRINNSTVEDLSYNCSQLKKMTDNYKIDLIVFLNNSDCINYGCGCMENSFPPTLRPDYERRTWRLAEEKKIVRKNILFLRNNGNKEVAALKKISNSFDGYLLENNDLPTIMLLVKMKIHVRPFE
jgi:hypothetical protein